MTLLPTRRPRLVPRLVAALVCAIGVGRTTPAAQSGTERLWLAGRYDRTHFLVYFEAVHFNDTFPTDAASIAPPVADGFFGPKALPRDVIARFQKDPKAERFDIGDRYDVLLDGGGVASMSLTALVGFNSDEFVGNDSYVGAIGQVSAGDLPLLTMDYYAVRRHGRPADQAAAMTARSSSARLLKAAVLPSVTTTIASLLRDRLNAPPTRLTAGGAAISIARTQGFTTTGGDLRYFVVGQSGSGKACKTITAWIAPAPVLHVVAAETVVDGCNGTLAEGTSLLNVVDLGVGRTGLIILLRGGDGMALELVEYKDGFDLRHMRKWQRISVGE
jgi:hypothetical protein